MKTGGKNQKVIIRNGNRYYDISNFFIKNFFTFISMSLKNRSSYFDMMVIFFHTIT